MADYLTRSLEAPLRLAMDSMASVVVSGPRQAGKTTLVRHVAAGRGTYVSMDLPDTRAAAIADPRGFLGGLRFPAIIDEVQRTPELLPYLKEAIDSDRDKTGRYVLTGSQNLLLMSAVNESLAGRAAVLTLMPLSQREIDGEPDAGLPWETTVRPRTGRVFGANEWFERFLRTSFPEPALGSGSVDLWTQSFIATYLERDVRLLRNVGDLSGFDAFLRLVASRTGTTLDLSDLARTIGVSVNTAKAWMSVLVASYVVLLLSPYHANIGKRLAKRPKVYFTDVGLACQLVGLRDAESAMGGPMGGALFETAVVAEVHRALVHRGRSPELFYWGVSGRSEVDLLVKDGTELVALEVKLNATPTPRMADGIRRMSALLPGAVHTPGYVVHPGDSALPLGADAVALPFARL